jgi:hypothetical protein
MIKLELTLIRFNKYISMINKLVKSPNINGGLQLFHILNPPFMKSVLLDIYV